MNRKYKEQVKKQIRIAFPSACHHAASCGGIISVLARNQMQLLQTSYHSYIYLIFFFFNVDIPHTPCLVD